MYVPSPELWWAILVIVKMQRRSTIHVGEDTEKQPEHAIYKFRYMVVNNYRADVDIIAVGEALSVGGYATTIHKNATDLHII